MLDFVLQSREVSTTLLAHQLESLMKITDQLNRNIGTVCNFST